MYSIEQIYKLILSQDFKWCSVFDSAGNKVGYFTNTKDNNLKASGIVEHLKEFFSEFPQGSYTLQFKKSPTGSAEDIHKYKVSTVQGVAKKEVDMESLRASLKEDLMKEMKEQARRDKEKSDIEEMKKDYQAKLRELQTAGGKVNVLLEMFLMKLLAGGKVPAGNLAGENQQPDREGPQNTNAHPYTEEEVQRINASLKTMLNHMDVNTFCQFADKIQSQPSIVNTLKSFL